MRILVIGSGGREHAIVWKLLQSPRVRKIMCAPGNAGIARVAQCVPIRQDDAKEVCDLARKEKIDLVFVGPEAPLASGLVDVLKAAGIPTVGPTEEAAQLESSKVFSKDFMARHRVPTAAYAVYQDADLAIAYLNSIETPYPIVIKADGLAAGKGVIIAHDAKEAKDAVTRIMIDREFGIAGDRIVIEECLKGVEAS